MTVKDGLKFSIGLWIGVGIIKCIETIFTKKVTVEIADKDKVTEPEASSN